MAAGAVFAPYLERSEPYGSVALLSEEVGKRPRTYAWALHFSPTSPDVRRLSRLAANGLHYATCLAENAQKRKAGALGEAPIPDRLTIAKLADDEAVSIVEVNTAIKQARIELFGANLSDRAIFDRLHQDWPFHVCIEPGCENPLPARRTRRRRYCDEHLAPAARARRRRSP